MGCLKGEGTYYKYEAAGFDQCPQSQTLVRRLRNTLKGDVVKITSISTPFAIFLRC